MKSIFYITLGLLVLSSCKKTAEVTKVVLPGAFHSIEVNSSFTIRLKEDSEYYLEVIGNEEFVDAVTSTVSDSILRIESTAKDKWTHPTSNKVTIIIHAPPLKTLTANETCLINTITPITSQEFGLILKSKANEAELDLHCHTFYYWNNFPCGGIVTLHGQTDELKIWNTAIMTVDAGDLTTPFALVENDSKGDCTVNVSGYLRYGITSQGNIQLYGNPSTIEEIDHTGSGDLIKH